MQGPWCARFVDGPARDHERHWAVGPVWQRIRVVRSGHWNWVIVGGDGIPDDTEPWEGEVVYGLQRIAEGPREPIAYYEVVQ